MGQKRKAEQRLNRKKLRSETYRITRSWHKFIDFEFLGVNLGHCLDYVLIQRLNQIVAGEIGDGR